MRAKHRTIRLRESTRRQLLKLSRPCNMQIYESFRGQEYPNSHVKDDLKGYGVYTRVDVSHEASFCLWEA